MNKLLGIVTLMVLIFSLTACTPAPKKSNMVPDGQAQPTDVGIAAVSNSADALLNENDEKQLADLSNDLDDDFGLGEGDELLGMEI